MSKRFMQFVVFVLAVVLSLPTSLAATTNDQGETMIRVGLASSSNHNDLGELVGANLWNNTGYGAGYRFGYYDSNLNFVELARTDKNVEQVSVIKTQNTWFKGTDRNSYSNSDNGGSVVGCYHIQLPGTYSSFQEASAAAAQAKGFVAWIDGVYQVRVGAYTSKSDAEAGVSSLGQGSVVGTSSYGMNVIVTGKTQILFQFDGGSSRALGVLPDVTGAKDVRTWFWDIKYRGGFTYQRIDGGSLTVANVLELEDYVKGVAPFEMGRLWPLEALKTQATCARTYALRRLNYHGSLGFDVCNTDNCQVYRGVGSKSATWGPSEVSDQAVEETAGQVVWYKNSLADTYYSSSHGGASESAKNIWGTDMEKYPYLCGVIDPYEQTIADSNAKSSWTVSYTSSELTKRLQGKGYGVGTSIDHMVLTYSPLGNVIKLVVHWSNGQSNTFRPSASPSIRGSFGVDSIRFTVNGQTVKPGSATPSTGGFPVNGSGSLSSLDGLYAISGSGTVSQAGTDLYAISGSGTTAPVDSTVKPPDGSNEGGGTVTVSGSSYVFTGGGWGHQVGMSQYGANAMARLGFSYDEICEFYFPGTEVRPY